MTGKELEQLYPGLAAELYDEKNIQDATFSRQDIKVELNESGQKIMYVKGALVHSAKDPVREGQRLAALLNVKDEKLPLLIFGFGLGYAAEAAASLCPGRPLIIVERHPEILRAAIEERDLKKFLSENRIVFAVGDDPENAKSALSLFENNTGSDFPPCIKNRALTALDPQWYAAAENSIKTWLSRKKTNKATLKRFGKRWMKNLAANLASIRDRPGINLLKGIINGENRIPVFLAAAGPGLDCVSEILPAIQKRCITIAVDTSLRFFLSRGIEPDFTVSVDPQYWNYRHLDRAHAPKTRLVTESAVYPPCLRHSFKGSLLCSSFFPAGRFVEDRVDQKGELGAGGSVATSAWDFARIMGADAVWIAGLDLSFPANKTHFCGALFEDRSLSQSHRFNPCETWSFHALNDAQPFAAPDGLGGMVKTDKRLSLYASWFANRFTNYPNVKNFSFSGGGLAIAGLEVSSIEEFLRLPERRLEVDALLEKAFSEIDTGFFDTAAVKKRSDKYENAHAALTGGLKTLENIASEAGSLAKTASENSRRGTLSPEEKQKTLKKLDESLAALEKCEVREAAAFLFPEIPGADSISEDTFVTLMEYSALFYQALAETVSYNLLLFG